MSKQFLKFSQAVLAILFAFVLLLPAFGQKPSEPAPKKSSGTSATCDGALDIVPTKAMSFVRKRRSAKSEKADAAPQTVPAISKTPAKPPSK